MDPITAGLAAGVGIGLGTAIVGAIVAPGRKPALDDRAAAHRKASCDLGTQDGQAGRPENVNQRVGFMSSMFDKVSGGGGADVLIGVRNYSRVLPNEYRRCYRAASLAARGSTTPLRFEHRYQRADTFRPHQIMVRGDFDADVGADVGNDTDHDSNAFAILARLAR